MILKDFYQNYQENQFDLERQIIGEQNSLITGSQYTHIQIRNIK